MSSFHRIVDRWLLARRQRAITSACEAITPEHDPIAYLESTDTTIRAWAFQECPEAPESFVLGLLQSRFRRLLEAFLNSHDVGFDGRTLRDQPGFFPWEIDTQACLTYLEYLSGEGLPEAGPLLDHVRRLHKGGTQVSPAEVSHLLASFYSTFPERGFQNIPLAPRQVQVPSPFDDGHRERRGTVGEAISQFSGFARESLQPAFSFLCVHGSLATEDSVEGFSDFDTFGVVRSAVTTSADALLSLRRRLLGVWPLFYRVEPLQHHGIMLVAEQDLAFYSEAFFPSVLLRYGRTILADSAELVLMVRPSRFEERSAFVQLVQYFRNHRLSRTEFSEAFSLKYFLGLILLVPAIYYQATGRPVYKRDSFELAEAEWNHEELLTLQRVSRVRSEGLLTVEMTPDRSTANKSPEALLAFHRWARRQPVPPKAKERLPERLVDDACDFAERVYKRFRREFPPAPPTSRNLTSRLTDMPVPMSKGDYDRAAAEASELVRGLAPAATLARFGSVSVPGISDLDLIVIVPSSNDVGELERLPGKWSEMSPTARRAFYHLPPFVAAQDELEDLPEVYPVFSWETLDPGATVNDHVAVDLERYRESQVVAMAELAMLYFMRDTLRPLLTHVISARPLLLRLAGLRHSAAVLGRVGVHLAEWATYSGEIEALRGEWFELEGAEQRSRLLALTARGLHMQLQIVNQLREIIATHAPWRQHPLTTSTGTRLVGALDREVVFVTNWTQEVCLKLVDDAWSSTGRILVAFPIEFAALLAHYLAGPPRLSAVLGRRFATLIEPKPSQASPTLVRHMASLERRLTWASNAGLTWGTLPHWGFEADAYDGANAAWRKAAIREWSEGGSEPLAYFAGLSAETSDVITARGLVARRAYAEAIELLSPYLSRAPDDAEAHYLLGFALQACGGDTARSLRHYNLALEGGFSEFWSRLRRGVLLGHMGLTAEALADLETAATLEPQNSDVHQALTELRRFDRFDPVKQLIHGCRYEEAKALLGRFPIDDRDSGEYEYLKGCCEEGCGSIETALRCYDNAISLGHETAWLFGRRAVLISRLGRVGEARAEMAKAVALSEGRADMFDFIEDVRRIVGLETARHLIAGERYADALPILKSMLPESFGSGEIHYLLACCMERTGRHDEASQHLAQAQAQGWSDLSISPRRAEPL